MTQETERELVERLRGFEVDHTPDGWPAIQMKDVSALLDYVAALEAKQAEVQMPEPEWWVNYCAWTSKETASRIQESELASSPLYTDQQVRTLLAQHGIKIA